MDRAGARRFFGRLGRLFRRSRRLKVSREGKWFIAITIAVGLAAINTGNNLLFLLLGWMCSVIIASGVLSEQSLRGLVVSRQAPARIFAGRPFLMGISLRNAKNRLPSFSIEIEDLLGTDDERRPQLVDKKCYFLKIPAGRTQATSYRHTFARRGRYRFHGFRVSTKFPFALFRKSRDVELAGEVIVFPAVYPVAVPSVSSAHAGTEARGRAGRRGEFHGLREMRQGDDHRDVHWRSSAHKGRLMVREYEEESHRRATVLVDNALPAEASDEERDALERAISTAASLCASYAARGYAVRLVARGTAVAPALGQAQLNRILRTLALLPTVTSAVPFAGAAEPGSENTLVVRRGAGPGQRPPFVGRVVEVASGMGMGA
jgi:uncharacterized protein (DUF58 family)